MRLGDMYTREQIRQRVAATERAHEKAIQKNLGTDPIGDRALVEWFCLQLDKYMFEGPADSEYEIRRRQEFKAELAGSTLAWQEANPDPIEFGFLREYWLQLSMGEKFIFVLCERDLKRLGLEWEDVAALESFGLESLPAFVKRGYASGPGYAANEDIIDPVACQIISDYLAHSRSIAQNIAKLKSECIRSPSGVVAQFMEEDWPDQFAKIGPEIWPTRLANRSAVNLHDEENGKTRKANVDDPQNLQDTASAGQGSISFMELVQRLTSEEIHWGKDHVKQHVQVAKMFVKHCGTDDPRKMNQAHVGSFRGLLLKLPKNHGKSKYDKNRTLEEIVANGQAAQLRAEEQEAAKKRRDPAYKLKTIDLVGLDPGTINRYKSQIGNILRYCRANGYAICDLSTLDELGIRDPEDDSEKRDAFSAEECKTLFAAEVWSGGRRPVDFANPERRVIHDALYWVPLIGCYAMARLGEALGLTVGDIDRSGDIPAILIRDNEVRESLKSKAAIRRIPIHPELLRLGFLDFVTEIHNAGHEHLFPEIRERGKSAIEGLFDNDWTKVLDQQLPNARSEKKTFHSFRHKGNTEMFGNGESELRLVIMGHSVKGVNGRYVKREKINIPDDRKLELLLKLSNVTLALQRFPIRVSPLLRHK